MILNINFMTSSELSEWQSFGISSIRFMSSLTEILSLIFQTTTSTPLSANRQKKYGNTTDEEIDRTIRESQEMTGVLVNRTSRDNGKRIFVKKCHFNMMTKSDVLLVTLSTLSCEFLLLLNENLRVLLKIGCSIQKTLRSRHVQVTRFISSTCRMILASFWNIQIVAHTL